MVLTLGGKWLWKKFMGSDSYGNCRIIFQFTLDFLYQI